MKPPVAVSVTDSPAHIFDLEAAIPAIGGPTTTVTVAGVAEIHPFAPTACTVYTVVNVGETTCVLPFPVIPFPQL